VEIIKRDGAKTQFDKEKIVNAIDKASKGRIALDEIRKIAGKIEVECQQETAKSGESPTVEAVQDKVERYLIDFGYRAVAKAYMVYRDKRTREREKRSKFMKKIGEKLTASNVQNQNANVDEHSFGGRKGEAANELMKKFALDYCVSEMSKKNHLNNEIYIHDLDSYATGMSNCLSIPFDKLLANGFKTRQTSIRPAQSVGAAMQLVAVIFQLQSLQNFGFCL
jgi:anaerobic ribonucleoside-triphosphate reductase